MRISEATWTIKHGMMLPQLQVLLLLVLSCSATAATAAAIGKQDQQQLERDFLDWARGQGVKVKGA